MEGIVMKYILRSLSLLLVVAMLAGYFLLPGAGPAEAATQCYGDYTLIDTIENYGGCTGMQGMALDDTYLYNVKIASSTQDNAFITRTHRTSGSTSYLTNASTGTVYFTNLYHANDMEMVTINGVQNLLVATGKAGSESLVRFTLSGTTLTQVGNYTAILDGSETSVSSAQVVRVNGTELDLIVKKNKYLYYGTLDTAATSGSFTITHAFTLDVANVTINGTVYDMTDWLHQGFEYIDHKIFVPITGSSDMSISSIVVYDTQGASGTIQNDPSLSFYIDSATYSEKFEIESCGICPSDGKLYFNTNQATSSSGNYDAVHYITGYTYDPSGGATGSGVYRWETANDTLQSVTTGGATYNGLSMSQGSVSGNEYTSARFSLHEGVVLKHDEPWILEWKSSGSWTDGSLLFSAYNKSKYEGNRYLFRRKNSTLIALGEYSGGTFYNYGLDLASYGVDGTADHVYRMTNKIAADGTNMVYLSVDGTELGPMNNYYIAGASQGTTSDWISGKDFTFSYLGTDAHPLDTCAIDYIQIWGNGVLDQVDEPNTFRWESGMIAVSDTGLTANTATALAGSVSGSTYTDSRYSLAQDVVLLHDRPWSVEWQSEGAWTGGALLLAASGYSKTVDAPYLFRNSNSATIALGYHDGTQFNNYGVSLSDNGIDGTVSHTYRLTNKISADGSNMVYLYVDGVELGAMENYYIGGTAQGTTSDWVSGKDFTFSYLGTVQHDINATVNYLQIWENGIPSEHTPDCYRWETQNDTLTSITDGFTENTASQLAGSITDGTYSGSYFRFDEPVVLLHDRLWSVEWQSEGDWKDAANGSLLLCAASYGNEINAPYLYRRNGSQIIAFGERLDGYHQNYGISLSDHDIDGTAAHVYRLENRINSDGSNMVYLYVDGVELGAMNNYFKGGTAQNTTSDWISGKDFVFSYMGNPDFPVGNCSISYLQVEEGCVHSFGDWSASNATCTESGTQTRTCTLCGATESRAVAATGHSYSAVVTAPTCTADGYTTYTCTACGDSYTGDTVAAAGHSYDSGKVTTAATCVKSGVMTYTCTTCGATKTEDIPATSHSYTAVVTDPTCTADGYTTYTCATCGDSYTGDAVAATGHSYSAVVTAATCTSAGYTTYTCDHCGDSYISDRQSATGHSYSAKVTAPTCTAAGYTTYTCAACGDSYTADNVSATGHSYVGKVTAPTCTAAGYTTYTCATCGNSYTGDPVSATGHSYENGSCTTCGAADPDYVTVPTLTLSYPTLAFEDEIQYNAYFTVDDASSIVEMGMITFSSKLTDGTISDAVDVISGYTTSGSNYIVHSNGIPAKNLGDALYFKVYAKLSDGSYAYSDVAGYNAVAYAKTILNSSSSSDAAKALVVAMLNYGAAAQTYFGYNTSSLMNASLTAAQLALVGDYSESMVASVVTCTKSGSFVNNGGYSTIYPTVSFESAFAINYYFATNYTPDSAPTFYYWDAATYNSVSTLTAANATGTITMTLDGDQWYGTVSGIAAKEIDQTYYTAGIYTSGGTTYTSPVISYSLGKYCQTVAANGEAFGAATAVYGYYAKAYFA